MSKHTLTLGSVKGVVQSLTNRHRLKFTLYDSLHDKAVTCYVDEAHADELRHIWGKRVLVTGNVLRDAQTGRPLKITDVTAITVVPDTEPHRYRLAQGILADSGEPSEVTMRRVRDAK
jgi:hypothetical protein